MRPSTPRPDPHGVRLRCCARGSRTLDRGAPRRDWKTPPFQRYYFHAAVQGPPLSVELADEIIQCFCLDDNDVLV